MTTELTKAALKAIAAIDALLRNTRRNAHQLSGKVMGDAENASAELRRALTQRPAAQTEREDFEAWLRTKPEARLWNTTDAMLAAYQAGRASLPAPQQATPEPVEEPVGTVVHAKLNGQAKPWVTVALNQDADLPDGAKLFTRPAPGVPEDVQRDAERYRAINTPEIEDFLAAVHNEALHQRERWGSDQDAGKADADWLWLLGYLAGKALHAQTDEKRLHHIITTAAACLNWHAARVGAWASMRPGIDPAAHALAAAQAKGGAA